MKKFNEILNEKTDHYDANKIIQNKIWNLIDENLVAKMDGENSDKLSIIGKEKLVEELTKLVENKINNTKINILESYKSNPNMVNEFIEALLDTKKFKKVKEEIKEDYKKIVNTINSLKEKHPLASEYENKDKSDFEKQKETIDKMIDNFEKKWKKESNKWDSRRSSMVWNSAVDRVKELKSCLSDIKYSDKK